MDPINLILAINLFLTSSANFSGAKKGLKTSVLKVVEKPNSYLQKIPPNISALIFVLTILGIFKVGTLSENYEQELFSWRLIGLGLNIIFSWLQVLSYKTLGKNYSQDVVIMKEHALVTSGIYKFIRHPQYLSQILADLGAGLALLSFLVFPVTLIFEFPLFILRANLEEKILKKHFGDKFLSYKKNSGFMIPFIG
ncbi:MAG: isoprenylcysteine carboxylmethyltransferase family protein [Melioribacteraceae bacterium]|nr:isoprenylcysteine carboxylmethyltransferase family protein [Melioribacteraceae bacterium]